MEQLEYQKLVSFEAQRQTKNYAQAQDLCSGAFLIGLGPDYEVLSTKQAAKIRLNGLSSSRLHIGTLGTSPICSPQVHRHSVLPTSALLTSRP